jgi:hypothetical protein
MVGLIHLNGVALYAFAVTEGDVVRVRVSADEWARLDLAAGQRVQLDVPGGAAACRLLTAVEHDPPVVWLRLVPLSTRRAS